MLAARISHTLNHLARQNVHPFCRIKVAGISKMYIKNENMTYEDAHHKLTTYFFLPELKKKTKNTSEINKYSNTVSFVW
jgi:hypothetical protein